MSDLKDVKIGVYVQKASEEDKEKGPKKDKRVEFLDKEEHQKFINNMFSLPCHAS